MAKNSNVITHVKKGSIAEELGIVPGDELVSINDESIKDIIDYKFLISDEYIEVLIRKQNGEEWLLEIDKGYDEDLGIDFESPTIDRARSCANRCIFCFIDQLPKGMRRTLYFKDDDSRLSFLQGNFITLTNMSEDDLDRIIRYRISPLNISVHTTDPSLRIKMLGNRNAGNIYERLKKLAENGIDMNCQIVLCRGINDGENLEKTLRDLFSLHPEIHNTAVVPVGLSKYREGLYNLLPFDRVSAGETIDLIEKLQEEFKEKSGEIFARAADEFYILAGRKLPEPSFYGEYEQLEDGIGMMTYFLDNIDKALKKLPDIKCEKEVSVLTGVSASKYIEQACRDIEEKIKDLRINVYTVKNNFMGENITVTGLLTGCDIIEQLKEKNLGSTLYIPSNLLRSGEDVLLDDITVNDLKKKLNVKIAVCSFDGKDFLEKLCN